MSRTIHGITLAAVTVLLIAADAVAQQRPGRGGRGGDQPPPAALVAGNTIPDFGDLKAHRPDGSETVVSELVPDGGHLVIVTGCLTCPKFLQSYRDVEAIAHDYKGAAKPLAFVYLYKSLAHPENGGWIQPFTLQERLHQVKVAAEQLKTKVPFICDGMQNSVSGALGGSPNSFTIVDGGGTVIGAERWTQDQSLRSALTTIVGPAPITTTPEEIGVPPFKRLSRPASSEVKRVEVSGTMVPLKSTPATSTHPHYVKLRVEAEPGVMEGKAGKMYIGFHIDPVHGTHWNNLVDPVAYSITLPEGVLITPATGTGPKVTAPTDVVPREFLIDVATWPVGSTIDVEVRYFACSDKEGWCKPVTQTYTVALERDRSAGMAQGRWQRPGRGGDSRRGQAGRGGGGNGGEMLSRMDRNGDGSLSREEVRGRLADRFDQIDTNGDGLLDGQEMKAIIERMQQRGGSSRRGRGGSSGPRDPN